MCLRNLKMFQKDKDFFTGSRPHSVNLLFFKFQIFLSIFFVKVVIIVLHVFVSAALPGYGFASSGGTFFLKGQF